ncbi:MAG: outer membrane protein assembly factor BamD [Campylobacterales bacterium]|nr:outer membrane protein assembly factor BamD [Campylobacterales bacterium]
MLKYFAVGIFALFLIGCSSKVDEEFNKPALYWYQKLVFEASKGDLEQADNYFTSLQSEHINSPFLSDAMILLGTAHMNHEEYLLANFYFDEYIKRFGDKKSLDYPKFLKIKANFLSFKYKYRDQKLLDESVEEANGFIMEYPNSQFILDVKTMLTKMVLAKIDLNYQIASLYDRRDKISASEYYRNKNSSYWAKNLQYEEARDSFIREIFE